MNFSKINSSSLLGRVLRWPLRAVPKGMWLPVLQGPLRGTKWIVGAATHGCWLGSYELEKQTAFAKAVKPGMTVLDIGANVGFYTLLSSRLVGPSGRVLAFEPMPRNLGILHRHLALNAVRNAAVFEAAVSDSTGSGRFSIDRNASMNRLGADGELEVATIRLDDWMREGRIPKVDCIKMDIEGAEGLALSGAQALLSAHRPIVFLATHGSEVRARCLSLLRDLGFSVAPLPGDPDPDEFIATPG